MTTRDFTRTRYRAPAIHWESHMKPRYPAMRWSLVAIVCVVAGCSHYANVAGNLTCQGATASSCNTPVVPSTAPPMPPPPIDTPYAYVGYHDTGSTGPLTAPAA